MSTGAGATDSAAILDLVTAQAAVLITFSLAAGGTVDAPAAVAATEVATVTETFVKVVIVFKADTVTATALAAVAETINALPAADKAITVGGVSVQPDDVVVATTAATPAAPTDAPTDKPTAAPTGAPTAAPTTTTCCQAQTLACLACRAGVTSENYCTTASVYDANPTGECQTRELCCTDRTAQCFACAMGKSTTHICELAGNAQRVAGCPVPTVGANAAVYSTENVRVANLDAALLRLLPNSTVDRSSVAAHLRSLQQHVDTGANATVAIVGPEQRTEVQLPLLAGTIARMVANAAGAEAAQHTAFVSGAFDLVARATDGKVAPMSLSGVLTKAVVARAAASCGTSAPCQLAAQAVAASKLERLTVTGTYVPGSGSGASLEVHADMVGEFQVSQWCTLNNIKIVVTAGAKIFAAGVEAQFTVLAPPYTRDRGYVTLPDGGAQYVGGSKYSKAAMQLLTTRLLPFKGFMGAVKQGTPARIDGVFRFGMAGVYMNAFGAEHLHLGRVSTRALLNPVAPYVKQLGIAGELCLGSFMACTPCLLDATSGGGGACTGLSARVQGVISRSVPQDNYVYGIMAGTVTLTKVLAAFGITGLSLPAGLDLVEIRPRAGDAAITAMYSTGDRDIEVQVDGGGSRSQHVPRGMSAAGTVVLLPDTDMQWQADVELHLGADGFVLNCQQEPLAWANGAIKITAHGSDTDGPSFNVAARFGTKIEGMPDASRGKDPTAAAAADAAMARQGAEMDGDVAFLGMRIQTKISLKGTTASFHASASLFGVLDASFTMTATWHAAQACSYRLQGSFSSSVTNKITNRATASLRKVANDAVGAVSDASDVASGTIKEWADKVDVKKGLAIAASKAKEAADAAKGHVEQARAKVMSAANAAQRGAQDMFDRANAAVSNALRQLRYIESHLPQVCINGPVCLEHHYHDVPNLLSCREYHYATVPDLTRCREWHWATVPNPLSCKEYHRVCLPFVGCHNGPCKHHHTTRVRGTCKHHHTTRVRGTCKHHNTKRVPFGCKRHQQICTPKNELLDLPRRVLREAQAVVNTARSGLDATTRAVQSAATTTTQQITVAVNAIQDKVGLLAQATSALATIHREADKAVSLAKTTLAKLENFERDVRTKLSTAAAPVALAIAFDVDLADTQIRTAFKATAKGTVLGKVFALPIAIDFGQPSATLEATLGALGDAISSSFKF